MVVIVLTAKSSKIGPAAGIHDARRRGQPPEMPTRFVRWPEYGPEELISETNVYDASNEKG
jgi:hypothetical protein